MSTTVPRKSTQIWLKLSDLLEFDSSLILGDILLPACIDICLCSNFKRERWASSNIEKTKCKCLHWNSKPSGKNRRIRLTRLRVGPDDGIYARNCTFFFASCGALSPLAVMGDDCVIPSSLTVQVSRQHTAWFHVVNPPFSSFGSWSLESLFNEPN
jgi:hypothetical protein